MADGAILQPQDASESTPLFALKNEPTSTKLIFKAVSSGLSLAATVGLVLLGTASVLPGGTWKWRQGVIWTAVYSVVMPIVHVLLVWYSPESYKSRQRPPISNNQSGSDKGVTIVIILSIVALYVSAPINAFLFRSDPFFSRATCFTGLVMSVLGICVVHLASYQNNYATTNLEEQEGQRLIDTGMYAYARHPMYTGLLIYVIGFVLWFDSIISFVFVVCLVGALYQRMYMEEQQLHESLPGYSEYMNRVKSRLIPRCI